MAEVNSIFKFRGTLGNSVFRQRNGKTYVASRPASYNTPQTPEAIARRAKFKLCRALSNTLNRLLYVKSVWDKAHPKKMTTLGYIFRSNYHAIVGDSLEHTRLSPIAEFMVSDHAALLHADKITSSCNIHSGQGFDKRFSESVISEAVLYLSNPAAENSETFIVMPLSSDEKPLLLNESCTYTFPLTEVQTDLINKYTKKFLLQVYIVKNYESFNIKNGRSDNKIIISETLAGNLVEG